MRGDNSEFFLARLYEYRTGDTNLSLTDRAVKGAAYLAKKAMWFGQPAHLHEDGVHRLLMQMGVTGSPSEARSHAVKYLSNLKFRCAENLALEVKRYGSQAFHFQIIPCAD